ncbi:MAG: PrsW family glutamic-type intramembrane protease, partial [bacterium]|nr:PrsW family glutamic-type intramembrane protease [bacterium]
MFESTNLHIFLSAVVPALGYLTIIYYFGRDLISWKSSIIYLWFGILSIFFVQMLQFVFPHIQDHIFLDKSSYYIDLVSNEVVFSSSIWSWIFYAFVQIAVLEEFMKGTAFKLTSFPRRHKLRKQKDSLLATMFYSGCVAAGFAIFENITYAMHFLPSYGESQTQILMSQRSIFAVLSHMISGLIMGYGFAIGSVKTGIKRLMY